MTTYHLKSAHTSRSIKVDVFADGQTPERVPLRISDGKHCMVLHFKPEEITEHGPEVAAILDTALDVYIARLAPKTETESPNPDNGRPFLVKRPASPKIEDKLD